MRLKDSFAGIQFSAAYNFPVTYSAPSNRRLEQTLLVDADDTLWENNVYFERVIAEFITYVDHSSCTRSEVREHLNRTEQVSIATRGYGLRSFRHSLLECFETLRGSLSEVQRRHILSLTEPIAQHEIELLPRVQETLSEISRRHRLILVTKGDSAEQTDKLQRSGLASYFSAVEVLPEKDEQAYRVLRERHRSEARSTWMIGNSPRSDVCPALAAGLHAVFIPHEFTWVLEHETVQPPPRGQHLLELAAFADLTRHF